MPARPRASRRRGRSAACRTRRLLPGILFVALASWPFPVASKACLGVSSAEAVASAALIFEGVVLTRESSGESRAECPRQRLTLGLLATWKRGDLPAGRIGVDDRGRRVVRLRGGESCHGCGARVGARLLVYATAEGTLLRLVRAGRDTGYASRERARLAAALGDPAAGTPARGGGAAEAERWPELGEAASGGVRLACVAVSREAALERAEVVFSGFVAATRTPEEATGECRPTIAVFRPHRVWKGEPQKELTLHPGASCLGCDVVGHRILVYAERGPEGRLRYLRTRAVDGGAAELAWLGEPSHASVQDPLMDTPLAPLVLLVRFVLHGWGGHGGLLGD